MSPATPKRFEYEVAVDRSGKISAEDEATFVDVGDEWTADHLLLAAAVRCAIVSLQFHARRLGSHATASGTARGVVTRPEGEDLHRFVEIQVTVDATLDPPLDPSVHPGMIAKVERGCFVGSSLITKPTYTWQIA